MIESNNLEINVDELMQKVRDEVSKRYESPLPGNARLTRISPINTEQGSHIENLLNEAELFAHVPSEFPDKFKRFPFNLSQGLQTFILKLYGFLFKKQRVVNFSLIQALRDSLALNRQLVEQVTALQLQVKEMSDRLNATDDYVKASDAQLNAINERYIKNDCFIKNELAQQKQSFAKLLDEAKQRLPEPLNPEQLKAFVNENQHLFDAFYTAFEDEFRGSREEILGRLQVYLPLVKKAKIGTPESPILDVGCGRGEWLELLQQSGYIASGLDLNRVMLNECISRGLEVIEGDVLNYMQSLPDASLGAVTGFHIVEHLPFPMLLKLLDETRRVLQPGGLALFETPNPQNVLVSSNNFYIDPTHLKPLPSILLKFLLEHTGFEPVEVIYLNPYQDSYKVSGSEVSEKFNEYFYGPQDYAVVGHKL